MAIYYDYVTALFDEKSDLRINNDNADNAGDLYKAMFKHADKNIRIACDRLGAEVFDRQDVCDCIKGALDRGVRFQIAMAGMAQPSKSLTLLAATSKENPDQVIFYTGGGFTSNGKRVNFTVMDRSGYRYERDASQPKAVACANEPELAGRLCDIFDSAIVG